MVEIITNGRTDIEDFFKLSGIREYRKLNHCPVLVFTQYKNEKVNVEIVDKPIELLSFPDDFKAMAQWRGEWRSDFFQFTIGEFKEYIRNNPAESYQRI